MESGHKLLYEIRSVGLCSHTIQTQMKISKCVNQTLVFPLSVLPPHAHLEVEGYFTNHSLRATAATRLYDARIDEATIMDRTGHKSTDGVRTYKRESDKLKELSSNVSNQAKRVKVDTSCDIEKEDKSVSSLGAVSENIEPVIAKEEACKMAIRSGASGMTFGGNNCNFTINFSFEQ